MVSLVITHERFNLDNMLNSDIALLKIEKPIVYGKFVQPVCLPDNSYDEPLAPQVIVAGWGALKFNDDNIPMILQDVALNVVKDAECAKKYRMKKYTLYKSQFCTWNYKKDACQVLNYMIKPKKFAEGVPSSVDKDNLQNFRWERGFGVNPLLYTYDYIYLDHMNLS